MFCSWHRRAVPKQHQIHTQPDWFRVFGCGNANALTLLAHCGSSVLLLLGCGKIYFTQFRDWKWKIRFLEKKKFRMDLPLLWFIVGGLYDILGRTIWILIPMVTQDRGLIEMTRRLAWNLLRLEREQVFYFKKPERNRVKNLNN